MPLNFEQLPTPLIVVKTLVFYTVAMLHGVPVPYVTYTICIKFVTISSQVKLLKLYNV